jgi:hypothetical protein
MSSKKELVVVGDSYCVDYAAMRNLEHIKQDQKYIVHYGNGTKEIEWKYMESFPLWGEIVAKELNLKFINLSQSGAGNDHMFAVALDYILKNKKNIGKIIIAWSGTFRIDFENPLQLPDQWVKLNTVIPKGLLTHQDNVVSALKDCNIPNITGQINKFFRYVYSLQIILESLNIDYYMIQSINERPYDMSFKDDPTPKRNDYVDQYDYNNRIHLSHTDPYDYHAAKLLLKNSYFELINEDKFIGWPLWPNIGGFTMMELIHTKNLENHINKYDGHPNENGNKLIAKTILDEILNLKSLQNIGVVKKNV